METLKENTTISISPTFTTQNGVNTKPNNDQIDDKITNGFSNAIKRRRHFSFLVFLSLVTATILTLYQFRTQNTWLHKTFTIETHISNHSSDEQLVHFETVHHTDTINNDDLESPLYHRACFVYDKPYRTGSTTISHALRHCWTSLRYHPGRFDNIDENDILSAMVRLPSHVISVVGLHIGMSTIGIEEMRRYCQNWIYITSTRPMKERLASMVKFTLVKAGVHTNASLNLAQTIEANRRFMTKDWTSIESLYERYPFQQLDLISLLKPTYIIRSQLFDRDLSRLLNAFGCSSQYDSTNVHFTDMTLNNIDEEDDIDEDNNEEKDKSVHVSVNVTKEKLFDESSISLQFGDARHRRLSRLAASRNRIGLKKIKVVIQAVAEDD